MTTALWNGVNRIVPFSSLEETLAYKENHPETIIAGERNGKKVDGFDRGNSPLSYSREDAGKTLAMTTTNGTKCIELSSSAEKLLIGSFLNLTATVEAVENSNLDVVLFCAGWKNLFNLEDFLFAGAMAHLLSEKSGYEIGDDASLAASMMYKNNSNNLLELLKEASHPKRFAGMGITEDLPFCLQVDCYPKAWEVNNGMISKDTAS